MHRVEARIRRYVEADRAAVLSLSERLLVELPPWRDAPSVRVAVASAVSAVLDAESDSSTAVFVAELGGVVVGFLTVSEGEHFAGRPQASIDDLVVDVGAEGRGIGSSLISSAEQWAKEAGAEVLTVETTATNKRALDVYRRAGLIDEDIRLSKDLRP